MFAFSSSDLDAGRASELVKDYFDKIYHQTGAINFKIEDVNRNSDKDIWIVKCSFFISIGNNKRTNYEVKVNVKTGKFISIQEKQ